MPSVLCCQDISSVARISTIQDKKKSSCSTRKNNYLCYLSFGKWQYSNGVLWGKKMNPAWRVNSTFLYHSSSQPGHLCSFCYRGERSLLGQGDLTRYEPTAGFNVWKRQLNRARRASGESDDKSNFGDKSPKPLTWRRARGPLKGPVR